jgi:uncharacterized protein (UPF0216 family)
MKDERTGFDKMLRYVWKWEVDKINDHLPKKTVPLSELLGDGHPTIQARDGTSLWIDQEEVMRIADLIPTGLHSKLYLPLILIRRIDLGEGVFSIGGGKLEGFLVARILGTTQEPFTSYECADIPLYIYRPQVQELRRKLRSLSVIGFGGHDQKNH